ncbi:bifunctional phosphopantothenoylcysteine decarboxylase/phosphopantothenate--cysteine ligase CoaBC [Algihabitans albus]|uniref:bifunctional phosphopantothenoylcysteine decarboxylase/phosphopantothenate--cysteine ligase CoaBC n=1 Tax=Algihabitans albus TaxID=2164067 RepID=UPI000E5D0BFC|nr:bifunctional phosphopantothenoylcysteine decarboxylase/phosphopantothenate--cysteine ligase CoaBC [Algihabitans albus]
MLSGRRILLVVAGGIAAYKTLELIRRLRERGASVRALLTPAGAQFVTPLSLAALSGDKVYSELFDLNDEAEMGHIQLSRDADLVVVAPATADIMAKLATGRADDLASTALLATDKPVLMAPAMNVRMWEHPATRSNLETLKRRATRFVGPNQGDMACGEYGYGRMAEPAEILAAIEAQFHAAGRLTGRRALVTSGPTFEALDPVRFLGNRSSGRQGHAVAAALAAAGAETTLVTGPVALPDPPGVATLHVETAEEMLAACREALPVEIAVCAAAVADWRPVRTAEQKLKKGDGSQIPEIALQPNPDILASLSRSGPQRPRLVVGFAAETEKLVDHARAKLTAKGCDWILANDVSPASGTFGGDETTIHLVEAAGVEAWPRLRKQAVADRLVQRIAETLDASPTSKTLSEGVAE